MIMSKTLINLNYDYLIQNEYDVIDYAMKHSDTFSVCVIKKKPYSARPPVFDFSEYIVPYAVDYIFEKSSRPVKFLGGNDPMIICKVDRNSRRSLHELLGWFEPIEKNMPTDICFYRGGRVWFATISHERMAQIYEPTDEDVKFFKDCGTPLIFNETIKKR